MFKQILTSGCRVGIVGSILLFSIQGLKAESLEKVEKKINKAEVVTQRATLEQNGLLIRPKNFIVNPSTGPVHEVMVTNTTNKPFSGTIAITYGKGWTSTPKNHKITLKPHESKDISQAITKAVDYASNSYPVKVVVKNISGKEVFSKDFTTKCFSAPYYEVKIDGNLKEWKDSIPISFKTKGKNTKLRTYWDRDNFYIAVEVEEDKFMGTSDSKTPDCIQISLSNKKAKSNEKSFSSNQFVAVGSNSMWSGNKVYNVISPSEQQRLFSIPNQMPNIVKNSQIDVDRDNDKKITTYEIAIPFSSIKGVKPTAGRGLNFSILVHDPDGTGIRELASVMNMPQLLNEKLSTWVSWYDTFFNSTKAKYDDKVDFGFCSSLH